MKKDTNKKIRIINRTVSIKTLKRILSLFIIFAAASPANAASPDWQLWIVPESRAIDVGKPLKFVLGVTGGGYLNPHELKVMIYSEADSKLRKEGDKEERYDSYAVLFNKDIPKDVFQKLNNRVPSKANQSILFEAEQKTPFAAIYVTPESPGDKKIKIILSYKDNKANWHTISDEFSYHARSFSEKYQTYGFILAIIVAIITIRKDALKDIFSSLRKSKNRHNKT